MGLVFPLGGGGGSKKSAPCFLVPNGGQPTASTLALWWLKFGPTEGLGGGIKGVVRLRGGIVREKGTLAPLAPLAGPKWTRWPKMLAYMHTK